MASELIQILNFSVLKFPPDFLVIFPISLLWFPIFSFIMSLFPLPSLRVIIAALKSCRFLCVGRVKAGLCGVCFTLSRDHIFLILDTSSSVWITSQYCTCLLWRGKMCFCLPFRACSSWFYILPTVWGCYLWGSCLLGAYSDIPKAELPISLLILPRPLKFPANCMPPLPPRKKFLYVFTQVGAIRAAKGKTVSDKDEICHPPNWHPSFCILPVATLRRVLFCHQSWKDLAAFSSKYYGHLRRSTWGRKIPEQDDDRSWEVEGVRAEGGRPCWWRRAQVWACVWAEKERELGGQEPAGMTFALGC